MVFDEFIEKFVIYLTANMTGAKDIIKTIQERDDTFKRIDKDGPKDLTTEEAASTVKVLLNTKEVKKFQQKATSEGQPSQGIWPHMGSMFSGITDKPERRTRI